MFLSIDAGNSNIVFGFCDKQSNRWIYKFRIQTKDDLKLLQIENQLNLFFLEYEILPERIEQIGISSVVPDINPLLKRFCQNFLGKTCYLIDGQSYQKL